MSGFLGPAAGQHAVYAPNSSATRCYIQKYEAVERDGFAAIGGPDSIPGAGTGQMLFFVGALELAVMKDSANGAAPGDFVGDFRNGYIDFGWDNFDEETKLKKRAVELNNGRAAMMGILGLMVHEQLGGSLPIVGEM